MFRRLTVRVFIPAITAAAIVAPTQDVDSHASDSRSPLLVEAAAHAATMRAIGAKLIARSCS